MLNNNKIHTRWITGDMIRKHLTFPTCIDLMRGAMKAVSNNDASLPLRSGMPIPNSQNMFGIMPGYLGGDTHAFGIKLISLYPENARDGYPSHMGLYVLFEAENGRPLAVMDANALTAIRTASATAAATDVLANKNVATLLIAGTGEQAENHLHALLAVRDFKSVLIWGYKEGDAAAFVKRMQKKGIRTTLTPVENLAAAARQAEVITTVTASPTPILFTDAISSGAHVNAVGSSHRNAMELAPETLSLARFFVDYRASAMDQASELLTAIEQGIVSEETAIDAEIGEVMLGVREGRTSHDEITIYKSVGVAAQDIAAAAYIYNLAEKKNLGSKLAL